MNPYDESLDPRLQNALDQLKPFPPRHARVAARGRVQFLAQARSLQSAVPIRSFWRQIGWTNLFQRKERFSMGTLATVFLIVTLAFGSGATVNAAQDALPGDSLYPVKIASEDAQISFASDAQTRANLLLDFVGRRTQEIVALGRQGLAPDAQVLTRQQDQLQTTLQIAASLQDESMDRLLARSR